jgi:hypothetical protein
VQAAHASVVACSVAVCRGIEAASFAWTGC